MRFGFHVVVLQVLGKVLGGLYSLCNTKSESDPGPVAALRMIWGSAAQEVGGL